LHTNQPNFTSVLNEEKPTNLIAEEEGGAPTEWVCGHWLRVVGDLHAADVTPSLVLQQNTLAFKLSKTSRGQDRGLGFRGLVRPGGLLDDRMG
jgi:hypothetical protein